MVCGPTLLVAAHGTRSESGTASLRALAGRVERVVAPTAVRLCFVDVREPRLTDVLAGVDGPGVIVPALLSVGHHVRTDIPGVVGDRPDTLITAHLGPEPEVIEALADRLKTARGARAGRPVALVAAGSRDPDARTELHRAGAALAERLHEPVLTYTRPEVSGRLEGMDVVAYVIAEGHFADAIADLADGVCTTPIGRHPAVADLVARRFRERFLPGGGGRR
ncbi:MAG: sirohydrochlorin chelatase [Actinobacteria bacterium]|nr:sirohydrochlorin chelatase [Actinomycetota bacterium]